MEPFKRFISPQLVRLLATHLAGHCPGVDPLRLSRSIIRRLGPLELKQRVQFIADRLHDSLPPEPAERASVLLAMLRPEVGEDEPQQSDERGIAGWGIWPLALVVGQHGVDDFDRSMAVLREMTKRSTSEFAIRYFLLQDQPRALDIMQDWVSDSSHHVRRLVSEGTRPRLPWAMQLTALRDDPRPVLPLLEQLRDDPSDYVRRSVANHLNDISRDNPALALQLLGQWMRQAPEPRQAMLRHASRTLLKAGDPSAMRLFGYSPPQLKTGRIKLACRQVSIGDKLRFAARIRSTAGESQKLSIDFVVHYLRANGSLSKKVFKGANMALPAGESVTFERAVSFVPVTTRRYYPGEHQLSLRINGYDTPSVSFTLLQAV